MAPPPTDPDQWEVEVLEPAVHALLRERDGLPAVDKPKKRRKGNKMKRKLGLSFKPEELSHRRGRFAVKTDGVSYGGGQIVRSRFNTLQLFLILLLQYPKRIYHSRKTLAALNRLRQEKSFIRLAGHASSIFAHWAPELYQYYSMNMTRLRENDPNLQFNFPNSIFACATYNFGPHTIAVKHLDHLNYIAGWCAVTSLGQFDYTRGGHIVLWDPKLVLEFPPGWTILLPSAYVQHGNTPISPDETRYSFTQYTAGGLFRYVDDGFKSRTQMTLEERLEATARQVDRVSESLNMYSTVSSLKSMYGLEP
jgi:hypothetical protein